MGKKSGKSKGKPEAEELEPVEGEIEAGGLPGSLEPDPISEGVSEPVAETPKEVGPNSNIPGKYRKFN